MEPVSSLAIILATLAAKSTIGELTGTVFGGLVEGLTGIAVFEALPKYVRGLLPTLISKSQPPVNHDLQKAILSAHWMATWVIVDGLQKVAEKKRKNETAHKVIINAAKDQLKKLKDENYLPSTSPDAYEAGELILKDPKLRPVTTLKASVIEFHLAELRTHSGRADELIAYDEIEETIRYGQPDWFELVCAFLNELLKGENNKAKDAFQNQELAKISVEVGKIIQAMESFEDLAKGYIENIGEQRFENFIAIVSSELYEVKDSLTSLHSKVDILELKVDRLKDKLDTIVSITTNSQRRKELNLDSFPDYRQLLNELDELTITFEEKQVEKQELSDLIGSETNERKKRLFEKNLSEVDLELLQIDEQRGKKKEEISGFRNYIEKTWLNLYSETAPISPRLFQARERFERGDLAGANRLLNPVELQNEFDILQQVSIIVAQKRASLSQDYLAKANFTVLEKANKFWFEKAKEYFQKAILLEETYDTYYAFGYFLYKHRKFSEAVLIFQKVLNYKSSDEDLARSLDDLAGLQHDTNNYAEAEKNYQEALQIRRRLALANPDAYEADVALSLNNLALLQQATNNYAEAEKNFKESLQIRRRLVLTNPDANEANMANTLDNLGGLQYAINQYSQAEKNTKEALQIYRRLALANPDVYEGEVAQSLNNLAFLQKNTNQHSQAEKNYQEALLICRRLALNNPDVYEAYIANILDNLALLQQATNNYAEAEKNYQEALQIRRRLALANPDAYEADVALSLNNLALLQYYIHNYAEAEKNYQESLQIYRRLALTNPDVYEAYIAGILGNLAGLQKATNQYSQAEKNFKEALQIYHRLALANPDAYEVNMALSLNNLALLQQVTNQYPQAEKNFKEALQIYHRLALANPDVYEVNMALSLNNLGGLQYTTNNYAEAEKNFKESLQIRRRMALANPDVYEGEVAQSLNNLALLQKNTNQHSQAEKNYQESLLIYRRLALANPDVYEADVAKTLKNLVLLQKTINNDSQP